MSDKAARSHTHTSNRAKARATIERKDIFKSVLENPFRIQWPSIPLNTQNLFLATLVTSVESTMKSGSRKSSQAYARKALPRSMEGTSPSPDSMVCSKTSACAVGSTSSPSPAVSKLAPSSGHITVGINEVTRRLESQLKSIRHSVTLTTTSHASPIFPNISPIAAVFVCRADVNPPNLLDHIPHLSALAQALGLRRAAVIAVHDDAPYLPIFRDMLESVPVISAPWLVPPVQPNSPKHLIPTHIKQLRTTTPKDMKSAKEQRVKARVAAKKNGIKSRPKKCLLTTAGPDA
ncbi:hypothetical protein BDR07DRAFT_1403508 [Suillus spraguei]|nr:hypothetical protein BDR07DRAFT_1403508 [Suillus spraguei]